MAVQEYHAEISRANPTCIVFLIDQSASMNGSCGMQRDKTKAEGVADILNGTLHNLTIDCAKNEGMYDYLQIGIIGYHSTKDATGTEVNQIESALQGPLKGEKLVPISRIGNNPLRIREVKKIGKDPLGREVVKTGREPVWVEPYGEGNTPLAEALAIAADWVKGFIRDHPSCFPPLVVNLTDGKPSTDPRPNAKALCDIRSEDGAVLFFNVHISGERANPVEYPATEDVLPQDEKVLRFAKLLFRMSSVLPQRHRDLARPLGLNLPDQARGFVFNADLGALKKFIEMGTKRA